MHLYTYAIILAAGSSIVSAGTLAKIPPGAKAKPVTQPFQGGVKPPVPQPLQGGARSPMPQPFQGGAISPVRQPIQTNQMAEAAKKKKISDAVDMTDQIMTQYELKHKKSRAAAGLRGDDNMPPPVIQFPLGDQINSYSTTNSYNGPITNNDNSVNAAAGANVLSGGSKLDQSRNDNSFKAVGSTVSGPVTQNGGRGGMRRRSIQPLFLRDIDHEENLMNFVRRQTDSEGMSSGDYDLKEDQSVVYRDFILLIKAMRRNPWAKEEVLIEMAGIPGMRELVEGLIQRYTDSDGTLTMNNLAALVDAMQDKTVERAVTDAFNSNLIYASIIEKILIKYSLPEDQYASKKGGRGQSPLNLRSIDDQYLGLDERSLNDDDDEYLEFSIRDLMYSFDADLDLWL